MSTNRLRSLLLISTLGLGVGQSFAASTLNVWIRASNDSKNIYQQEAEAFEKKTGIKIEYFNATTDFEQRLARAAVGNALPDLIFNDAASLGQFIQLGIVDEIDPKSIEGGDNLYPTAWESTRYIDGKHYGVPTSAQTFALFVRKDWREKLGYPQPKTWEDVMKLAHAFTQEDPDGNGKNDTYGFNIPGSTTRGYTSWFLTPFIWQAGGDYVSEKDGKFIATLNTPEVAEAVNFMRTMICEKVAQPGAINATTADVIPSFRSGQVGMFFTGPYHIAVFDRDPGKEQYEVVTLEGPKNAATLAEGTTVFLMKGSKQKEEARKFIEFMISKEGQEIGMGKGSKNIPVVRLAVNKDVDVKEVYQDDRWATFASLYNDQGRYVPQIPNWTPVRQITAEGFNRILANCSGDIAQELDALNVKVNSELDKQDVLAK